MFTIASPYTKKYLLALSITATLAVVAYWLLNETIKTQQHHTPIIKVSTDQQMLVQRIAFLTEYLASSKEADVDAIRTSIFEEMIRLKANNEGLMKGNEVLDLPGYGNNETLQAMYLVSPFNISEKIRTFNSAAQQILHTPPHELNQSDPNFVLLRTLAHGNSPYSLYNSLDKVTKVYKAQSEINIANLQNIEVAVLSFTFLALLLEALFIFRPMVQQIIKEKIELEQTQMALQETNNVLEQRVQDRTAALTRSNSDLAQFAYIASHDLKEPLRMVTNYVQLIEKRYSGQLDETGKLFMSYAVEGATRANRLIEDLLAYAKIDRKRHQKYVATDLNAIMRQVTQNLSLYIKEQKATVIIDDLPEIEAIPSQMIQLFQNLISNAIKFQRSNTLPQVEIMATEINNHFQFSIKDNGIGIDKTYTNKVFKIFQRLNPRNEYKGTGIGLAVCKKIAEGHGGQIWFDSMPNQGTTFYIALPKRQTQFVPSPVLPQEESVSFNIENTLYVAA